MRRRLMLLSACCLVLLAAGCGGDDGEGRGVDAERSPDATVSTEPKDAEQLEAKAQKCDAEVSATGALEREWSGQASVRTGGRSEDTPGPAAVYTLTDGKHLVALYSSGPEFKGSVSLLAGNTGYASDPAEAESLDIDPKGTHAEVDVQLTSTANEVIQLEAEFTCGRALKKQD